MPQRLRSRVGYNAGQGALTSRALGFSLSCGHPAPKETIAMNEFIHWSVGQN